MFKYPRRWRTIFSLGVHMVHNLSALHPPPCCHRMFLWLGPLGPGLGHRAVRGDKQGQDPPHHHPHQPDWRQQHSPILVYFYDISAPEHPSLRNSVGPLSRAQGTLVPSDRPIRIVVDYCTFNTCNSLGLLFINMWKLSLYDMKRIDF